ncbi:uncharacterized protein LOC105772009 [Gossypium raimondii]|uniref:uncharacterized protein LOC105772009 n=1 Tax=Gossypium raimondii TaxID=29730 RepID=UPI00063B067F|nr:uncharacterized protein LOC105772009 [Gossypium raimondii]
MGVVEKLDNYLGLPLLVGKRKSLDFKDMTNRFSCRINSWSKRLLSYGDKEIFIKVILQSLPTYAFSIFLAPRGVLEDMQSKMSRMWWTSKEKGKAVEKPSYTWSSINATAKALKDGFEWKVGNGQSIDIRRDNWGFESLNGDTLNPNVLNLHERKVRDLWSIDQWSWNKKRVRELYDRFMGDQNFNLSLNGKESNDRVVWFHNPSGFYTSKTAYSWLLLRQMGFGPHRAYWKIIWKLNTLLKIHVFTWRVGHEILPTNDKIASIHHGFLKDYTRYSASAETLIHALKDCPNARTILTVGGFEEN